MILARHFFWRLLAAAAGAAIVSAAALMCATANAQGYGGEATQFGQWVPRNGSKAMTGNLDMNLNLVLNIGNAGTDFTAAGGLTLAQDLTMNTAAGQEILFAVDNDAVTPSLTLEPGTGLYASADNTIGVAANAANVASWDAASLTFANANGPYIENAAASATNPTLVPDRSASTTGFGFSAGSLYAINAGVSLQLWASDGTVGPAANAYFLENAASSATNPTLMPDRASVTAGMGGTGGAVSLITAGVERINIAAGGTISATAPLTTTSTVASTRSTDLGWSVVNAANQACNTTCTNACVIGIDTITTAFLMCTDATADSCLCAGAN